MESSLSPYTKYVPQGDQATFKFCAVNEKNEKKKLCWNICELHDNFKKLSA